MRAKTKSKACGLHNPGNMRLAARLLVFRGSVEFAAMQGISCYMGEYLSFITFCCSRNGYMRYTGIHHSSPRTALAARTGTWMPLSAFNFERVKRRDSVPHQETGILQVLHQNHLGKCSCENQQFLVWIYWVRDDGRRVAIIWRFAVGLLPLLFLKRFEEVPDAIQDISILGSVKCAYENLPHSMHIPWNEGSHLTEGESSLSRLEYNSPSTGIPISAETTTSTVVTVNTQSK
jgi:hypothetical protein